MQTDVPEWKSVRQNLTAFEADDKGYYKSEGSIELRIDQFEKFVRDGKRRYSIQTHIRGLPWTISAKMSHSNWYFGKSLSKYLSVYLYCPQDSTSNIWECEATYLLSIVAQKRGVKDIVWQDLNNKFNEKENGWGVPNIATSDLLLDPENGFIKDDALILRAHVKPLYVNVMSRIRTIENGLLFSSSTKHPWDFVLIIQGKEVHVQKSYLAMHSEYFKDQFIKHEHDDCAMLQEVNYGEFIELLCIIYPTSFPITAENVATISKLAFQFGMAALLSQCEIYLMDNFREVGTAKSLLAADWYKMVLLLGNIMDEINNIADVRDMQPEYHALSYRTKRMLLDKVCSLRPIPSPASDPEDMGIATVRSTKILQKLASSVCCPSDGVLVVENNRISIHKMYLAIYSEYFTVMFQREFTERNKDEIVLEEVAYSDILELLAIVYPTGSRITDKNVGVILKMADRFIMPVILERCKKQLQNSTKISTARKLWYAQRYNLPELQAECAQKCKRMTDVEKLRAEPEYCLLDDKTLALILDSVIS